jgi:hypothetical protein
MQAGQLAGLKALRDAGTLVVAGTDTMIAPNLHGEIASYVRGGFTPFQALQTATVNAAKALNLDAGTLEPGKLADIVLIEGIRARISRPLSMCAKLWPTVAPILWLIFWPEPTNIPEAASLDRFGSAGLCKEGQPAEPVMRAG